MGELDGQPDVATAAGRASAEPPGMAAPERRLLLESHLREQIARALGVPREVVQPHRPLTGLGLDSLAAIELAHALETGLGHAAPFTSLMEGATLASLVDELLPQLDESAAFPGEPADEPAGEEVGEHPASIGQRALWVIERLAPASGVYNISAAARVHSRIERGALQRALRALVARHPALRTVFAPCDGEPRQRVLAELPAELRWEDALGPTELAERLEAELRRPFDLERGPLLSLAVFAGSSCPWIVFSIHHIVADLWSLGILVRELGALYRQEAAGEPAKLSPLTLRYTDHVRSQERWLAGPGGEEAGAWWQSRLAGAPALDLPLDRPRGTVKTYRGGALRLAAEVDLDRLQRVARDSGATLYMLLLAAYGVLLGRYASQQDLVVGSPYLGRGSAALSGIVGYFVNVLALRLDLAGESAVRALLGRMPEVVLPAFKYGEYPLARLAQHLQPARDAQRSPPIQALFVLQRAERAEEEALAAFALGVPGTRLDLGGLQLEAAGRESVPAQFDLALQAAKLGTGLTFELVYDADLFDASTAERLARSFRTLLAAIAESPEVSVTRLPLLSPEEQQAILQDGVAVAPAATQQPCLHELFLAQAACRPRATALVAGSERVTYGELAERSSRLARYLRRLGVGPEVRVAIAMERGIEMVVGLLGILQAGGAYVPLDPTYPPERLAFMLADSAARLLLTEEHLLPRLPASRCRVVCPRGDAAAIAAEPGLPLAGAATAGNLAYLVYTSGSTGRPKAVGVEHRSAAALLRWARDAFSDAELAGVLASTSLCFDLSVFELFVPLSYGGSAIVVSHVLEPRRPGPSPEITLINTVPSLLAELLHGEGLPASVRTVNLAGEALPAALVSQLAGLKTVERILNLYGPSEDTTYSTWSEARADGRVPAIGRPLPGTHAYVLDPWLEPVAWGVAGELALGGSGLARGYVGRPELTAERFVPDPWGSRFGEPGGRIYRTGDVVRRRSDGQLVYLGRLDHQVKIRGLRVELGEIEAALEGVPGVRRAAVVARRDGVEASPRLVAYVASPRDAGSLAAELERTLVSSLPRPMQPAAYVVLESLPLSPNGKVDRRALPAPGRGSRPRRDFLAPASEVQRQVAGIMSALLGVADLDMRDSFFALGGHSLLASRLVARVLATCGVELRLSDVFATPTVEAIAAAVETERLRRAGAGPEGARPQRSRDETGGSQRRVFPLSSAQQRLWLLQQQDPESPAYHLAGAIELTGELDVPALAWSLRQMARRHESLRTTFIAAGGTPAQVVAADLPPGLSAIDLSALPAGCLEGEAARLASVDARRSFDLSRGPLLRSALLTFAPRRHRLLLTFHHVIADGWSCRVFARDLAAFYRSRVGDAALDLPDLPIQYADYAVWHRQWTDGEPLAARLAACSARLAGLPVLELPADRPRPAVPSYRGASLPLAIAAAPREALARVCERQGATMFCGLLAVFEALLARLAAQTDFGVGSPSANRVRAETEDLIGCFVNTLVCRADLSGDPGLAELVGRVRRDLLGVFAQQEVPFEKLVERLLPERSASRAPLVQVMLALESEPLDLRLPGLDLRLQQIDTRTAKFDLLLSLVDRPSGLTGSLEYRRDLFDAATAERIRAGFEHLLAAAGDPERPLGQRSLLGAAELAEIVALGDRRQAGHRWSSCVHELIAAQALNQPDAVAVVDGGERLTYGELDRRARLVAGELQRLGVGPEVAVGTWLGRSMATVVCLLGIWKAGGAYVPLDPAYPRERLRSMLRAADVAVLLAPEGDVPELAELDAQVLSVAACDFSRLPGEEAASGLRPENLAYLIFTSGSTGSPKAVSIEHHNVVELIAWSHDVFTTAELSGVLAATSFSFDLSIFEVWVTLACGGRVILAENALALPDLAARGEVRLVNTVPSAMAELVRHGRLPAEVETVCLAGEALPPALVEDLYATGTVRRVVNLYGPSEDTTYSTIAEVDRGAERVPIGRPISGTRALVLDPCFQPAPPGLAGELCLGGEGVARGYHGRPELTAERFVPDPLSAVAGERLYRTGDRARWTAAGTLEFLGRADTQVKLRGFRIELGEIEATLRRHPSIEDVVAMVREDRPGDRRLAAYVVPHGQEPPAAELASFLRERLPEYMIPAVFVALAALPRGPNGKVDRRTLPAPIGVTVEYRPPRTAVEELVAGVWCEVLEVERVGLDDDFFALGGHSLKAMQVVSRVRAGHGAQLPVRSLFETPVLAAFAARVAASLPPREPAPELTAVPRSGPLPLSFAQERLWFLEHLEPGGAVYNLAVSLRLRGELDVAALAGTLAALERRHEALRTVYASAPEGPVQRVLPPRGLPLPLADLGGLPPTRGESEALRLAALGRGTGFDLAAGPPVRALLVRQTPRQHLLLLCVHHIAADGWSLGLLVRETIALYHALLARDAVPCGLGGPPPLAPGDHAVWQRSCAAAGLFESELAYWLERLRDLPSPPELPVDRSRPAVQTFGGASRSRLLAGAPALARLARAEGATLFMALLAAFEVLLHRHSGQDDILVGMPIAGRNRAELEEMVGCLLNTQALRTDLGGRPSFREVLRRVRESALGAYAHQEVPFELLLERLQPERDARRAALFTTLFNMMSFPLPELRLTGLETEVLSSSDTPSKFDLTCYLREVTGEVRLDVVYNADLFAAARIDDLLAQYEQLITAAAADPDRAIDSYSLLTARAREVLPGAVAPAAGLWSEPVHEQVARQARRAPDRIAVADAQGCFSYGELASRWRWWARKLSAAGLLPGERVAIYAPRGIELVWAVLAVLEARGIFVLLDPAYPAARLRQCLSAARVRALLVPDAAGPLPSDLSALLAAPPEVAVWALPHGPACPPAAAAPARPDGRDQGRRDGGEAGEAGEAGPEALAYQAFTSGSTGVPKGILGTHRPLSHFVGWQIATFGLRELDHFSMLSGLAHDPLLRDLFTPLCLGATLCIPRAVELESPEQLACWLRAHEVSVAHLTPAHGQVLSDAAEGDGTGLPALRYAFFGGDVLDAADVAALRRRAPAAAVASFYGTTETPQAMGFHVIAAAEAAAGSLPVPLGHGIDGVQLRVVNRAGEPAGIGELGEIQVRTSYLALGYLDDPALTADRFRPDGFGGAHASPAARGGRVYRTGDVGRHLPDGAVRFAGRADQQLKVRGYRVEPAEIEAVLRLHAAVGAAAVVQSLEGGGALVAYLAPAGGVLAPPAEDLRQFAAAHLPRFMVPAACVWLKAGLPRTPNGKVDRRSLARRPWIRAAQVAAEEPRTPQEEIVAGVFGQLLGRERVGRHDDFFALGGHSLLAMQAVNRVRLHLGVEVGVRDLFEASTVSGLAARLGGADAAEAGSAGGISSAPRRNPAPGPRPLSSAQLQMWLHEQVEGSSPIYNILLVAAVAGRLRPSALAASFAEVQRRHEILRTIFEPGATEPVQRVVESPPLPLCEIDLRGLPHRTPEALLSTALEVAHGAAARPFDLWRGPVMRIFWLRLREREHLLALSIHHLVADAWSLRILLGELAALYPAFAAGQPSPLAPPRLQYGDYCEWQRGWLAERQFPRQLAYWKLRLASAPPPLDLPTDGPRPRAPGSGAAECSRALASPLAAALRALCRREGVTEFMSLLAAVTVVLHHLSGAEDVVVGCPSGYRGHAPVEELIGPFTNILLLRTDLSGDPTFRDLLARVRTVCLEAYAHQDLPFAALVEVLQPERAASRLPLFQVALAFHDLRAEPRWADLEVTPLAVRTTTSPYELNLVFVDTPGGLVGSLRYRTDLFRRTTAERLLRQVESVVEQAVAAPGGRLSELRGALARDLAAQRQAGQRALQRAMAGRLRGAPDGRLAESGIPQRSPMGAGEES